MSGAGVSAYCSVPALISAEDPVKKGKAVGKPIQDPSDDWEAWWLVGHGDAEGAPVALHAVFIPCLGFDTVVSAFGPFVGKGDSLTGGCKIGPVGGGVVVPVDIIRKVVILWVGGGNGVVIASANMAAFCS